MFVQICFFAYSANYEAAGTAWIINTSDQLFTGKTFLHRIKFLNQRLFTHYSWAISTDVAVLNCHAFLRQSTSYFSGLVWIDCLREIALLLFSRLRKYDIFRCLRWLLILLISWHFFLNCLFLTHFSTFNINMTAVFTFFFLLIIARIKTQITFVWTF